jgi:CRISPR-associated protein Csb1
MSVLTFDELLKQDTVALVGWQELKSGGWLEEDRDRNIVPVFPPSYARGEGEEGSEYVLNRLPDGTFSCDLDSPQSQANRLEPLFAKAPLNEFIPQHTVTLREGNKSFFEIGHRVADAAVRFSDGKAFQKLEAALSALNSGNALPLARLAPTSLIFGFWDSRGTSKIKRPRLLSATVRATDVVELRRGAQYTPASRYEDLLELGKKRGELGLDDVPDRGLGGLLVRGAIVRSVQVNMVALREIRAGQDALTEPLQKYLLGLILLLLRVDEESGSLNLRQGCLLVGPSPRWHVVKRDGSKDKEMRQLPTADDVQEILRDALRALGGIEESLNFVFAPKKALDAAKSKKNGGKTNSEKTDKR